jgi:hypothetical protein
MEGCQGSFHGDGPESEQTHVISLEDLEMTQQPPEQDKNQNRAETATTQLLGTVPGREAAE